CFSGIEIDIKHQTGKKRTQCISVKQPIIRNRCQHSTSGRANRKTQIDSHSVERKGFGQVFGLSIISNGNRIGRSESVRYYTQKENPDSQAFHGSQLRKNEVHRNNKKQTDSLNSKEPKLICKPTSQPRTRNGT